MDLMQRRRELMAIDGMVKHMRLIGTYTVQESWENDTLGNAEKAWQFLQQYMTNLGSQLSLYVAVYINNHAQNTVFKADHMYFTGNDTLVVQDFVTVRNNRTNRAAGASNTRSFWASAGTIIKIYSLY